MRVPSPPREDVICLFTPKLTPPPPPRLPRTPNRDPRTRGVRPRPRCGIEPGLEGLPVAGPWPKPRLLAGVPLGNGGVAIDAGDADLSTTGGGGGTDWPLAGD